MKLPWLFARRYLISRKSHNLINVISAISVTGLAVGTMALIVVLSVFNGFESVIKSMYNSFNADYLVTPVLGKVMDTDSIPANEIRSIPGVVSLEEVLEEDMLLRYGDKQMIARIKGVEEGYPQRTGLDTMAVDGQFVLQVGQSNFTVAGAGVAWHLDLDPSHTTRLLNFYVARRGNASSFNFTQAFNSAAIHPSGVFSVQQEFDEQYCFVPIRFARSLMDYTNEISALEIRLSPDADTKAVEHSLKAVLGNGYVLRDRYQQNEALYKVLSSEKTIIFLLLVFILLLASFNMVGSLSVLMIEKNKDMAVLASLGGDKRLMRRIFLTEGALITTVAAVAGLAVGLVILYLQQRFGLLTLGGGEGAFIIESYPVEMHWIDFILVFFTVVLMGLLATWYPVRFLAPRLAGISLK